MLGRYECFKTNVYVNVSLNMSDVESFLTYVTNINLIYVNFMRSHIYLLDIISWQRHVNNEVVKFYDPMESIHPYIKRHHKIIHYHDRRCTPLCGSFFLSHILPFTFLTFCKMASKVTSFHPFSKRTSCSSYSFSNFAIDWIQLIYFFVLQIFSSLRAVTFILIPIN